MKEFFILASLSPLFFARHMKSS